MALLPSRHSGQVHWRVEDHLPSACEGIAFKPEKKRVHAETATTNKKAKRTEIKLAKAYQAIRDAGLHVNNDSDSDSE